MDFSKNTISNFSSYKVPNNYNHVIKINLKRAVLEYTEDFRNYMTVNHTKKNKDLILDLTSTNFIDSSFLGTIIVILKNIKIQNGSLSLVIDSSKITFILPIKNISKVLNIYSSVDEAIAKVNRFSEVSV